MLIRALGHQKMYFDVLDKLGLLPEGDKQKMGTYPSRCKGCACEIFNIVKWMRMKPNLIDKLNEEFEEERKKNAGNETEEEIIEKKEKLDEKIKGDVFCGNCQPEKSLFRTRSEYYTYSWSVDDLAKILDNYHYRPDATADSVFEPTIPPPGEADEPRHLRLIYRELYQSYYVYPFSIFPSVVVFFL